MVAPGARGTACVPVPNNRKGEFRLVTCSGAAYACRAQGIGAAFEISPSDVAIARASARTSSASASTRPG